MRKRILAGLLLGATFLPALQGCVPVVVAGATAGALATIDRRSLGTQTEDETIEWKASARVEAERIVSLVPNVAAVYNELVVGPTSSFTERSNDSFITSKVKSRSVDSGKYNPVHVKVVTEAGVVFLMGLVTQAEADSAINVARTTGGVKKVVNLFEIIEPAKARELDVTHSNNNSKAPEEKVQ